MKTRLLIVNPLTAGDISASDDVAGKWGNRSMGWLEKSMQKYAEKVCDPDTEIRQCFADSYSGSLQNLYLATVNNLPLVNKMIKAEEDGFDAIVVACHGDGGVQIARSVVHIPVVGPCEASMAVGSFVGEKFAMITIREQYLRLLEQQIRLFGFEDRFIKHRPVRPLKRWLWNDMRDAHQGKPEGLIKLFEETALECIADGADTILCPGWPIAAGLFSGGYREVADTGVPIVDGAAAALKMAEALASLGRSVGLTRTGYQGSQYQNFPKEFVTRALKRDSSPASP